MADYLRVDNPKDIEWLDRVITSLMNRDPNDRFLQVNYGHLASWREIVDGRVRTKSQIIPEKLITEEDKEELIPPVPKKRGRPPVAKDKAKSRKNARPAVIINDIFMCANHPNRTGKQIPRDDCEECWKIYKSLNGPAKYELGRRQFAAKQMKRNQSAS